jgi:hypothetical protein
MKKIFYAVGVLFVLSCNNDNKSSVTVTDKEYDRDTSSSKKVVITDPSNKPFAGIDSTLFSKEKDERLKRRMIVYMSIDSSYYALNAIEGIKNDIASNSSINLSVSERNLKSKTIQKLNAIQNLLIRQVDSVLLVNLKLHTNELAAINTSIAADVTHLKDISIKLSKVAEIMGRVTNVLTFCISRGIVKPPTPVNLKPEQVKSGVN